jgi:hypothetical protein
MTDDDPIDLAGVAADEDAIERVRSGDVLGDDVALAILRDLLQDVQPDADDLRVLQPSGRGSNVLPLSGDRIPERRLARNGTVVAALTAGLLSLGGVAAAASVAPDGSALHGLGEAVRSAAGAVVGAVTPPEAASGTAARAAASPSASPSASAMSVAAPRTSAAPRRQPTPGATVAALSRSQAAARQVAHHLDAAERLLADGRAKAADARLDVAESRLAEVLPADGASALSARLTALRDRVAAATATASPTAKPAKSPRPSDKPAPTRTAVPDRKAAPTEPAPRGGSRSSAPQGGKTKAPQLSRDASAKPRA